MFKLLFIGDIMGKIGRRATAQVLPDLKKKEKIDFVIANVENLAHGKGVTARTLQEIKDLGVDCFTSGNNVWRKREVFEIMEQGEFPLLRPANYPDGVAGCGYHLFKISKKSVFVINLQGRIFMADPIANPFLVFDKIIKTAKNKKIDVILVDFHAEATSEKRAFGFYADGRASAVIGTHTHTQTADEQVLPQGTGYITDAGFTGGRDTVLGVKREIIIENFLTNLPVKHDYPETGPAVFNSVLLEFGSGNILKSIRRVNQEVNIKD